MVLILTKPQKCRIGILPDTGNDAGFGHLSRCVAMAQGLLTVSHVTPVLVFEPSYTSKFEFSKEIKIAYSLTTAKSIVNFIKEQNIDLLVVDSYRLDSDFFYLIRKNMQQIRLIAIDDYGEKSQLPIYGIVNFQLNTNRNIYPEELLKYSAFGPKYYPLRQEVIQAKRNKKNVGVPEKIVVTMGGIDPDEQTLRITKELKKIPGRQKFFIIVGPAYPAIEELAGIMQNDDRFEMIVNPDNIIDYFVISDFAITSAGVTLAELMALETPFTTLALSDDQEPASLAVKKMNPAAYLGKFDKVTDQQIFSALSRLLTNKKGFSKFLNNKIDMVDKEGGKRLGGFLKGLILTEKV